MALDPIIPGAAWTVQLERVSGDPYVPSDHRILLVLDSPKVPVVPSGVRITKEFLPAGGGDTGAEAVGDAVRFTLSPSDTAAAAGLGGNWQVFVFAGDSDEQYPLHPTTTDTVRVISPNRGAVPHG